MPDQGGHSDSPGGTDLMWRVYEPSTDVILHRVFRRIELWDSAYGGVDEITHIEPDRAKADVVTSSLTEPAGMHGPLFDLDIPTSYYPSGTPGHAHLYIDKPVTWRAYKRVLRAMWKAGLIEKGYYLSAKRRGYATLRLPEKPKQDLR